MQKTNPTTNCYMVSLPPIRSLETPKPSLKRIRELENKVWSLQQQLCESRAENKLLKNVQHRHVVALQHFQDSENSIAQVGLWFLPLVSCFSDSCYQLTVCVQNTAIFPHLSLYSACIRPSHK